ncbi:MAG TPA: cupin domain-containing protein [Acidimicrobiales bacterium]|nr:cupin domain-containing protein [Acidimicrobiales bacterium]
MGDKVVIRASDESEPIWMLGGLYEIKVAGEDTGGAASVVQMTVPEGAGPPPHIHSGGEITYIIEGTALYQYNGEKREARAGTVLYFPKGTVETFEPVGATPLKVLSIYMPGGIDKFFGEAGEPAARREVPPAMTSAPDLARLAEIGSRYGLELQAPS